MHVKFEPNAACPVITGSIQHSLKQQPLTMGRRVLKEHGYRVDDFVAFDDDSLEDTTDESSASSEGSYNESDNDESGGKFSNEILIELSVRPQKNPNVWNLDCLFFQLIKMLV